MKSNVVELKSIRKNISFQCDAADDIDDIEGYLKCPNCGDDYLHLRHVYEWEELELNLTFNCEHCQHDLILEIANYKGRTTLAWVKDIFDQSFEIDFEEIDDAD